MWPRVRPSIRDCWRGAHANLLPLFPFSSRKSRNFILKTYIYTYISRCGRDGYPITGAGRLKPDWELLAGVSDIFHAGMFLSECTGTSDTIFECQSSLMWIISISRFRRALRARQSIAGTFVRPANIFFLQRLSRIYTRINSSGRETNLHVNISIEKF